MGNGYQPHRVILDEAADYWRMGPGQIDRSSARNRFRRLRPPRVEVTGDGPGRYYAVVRLAECSGEVPIGITIGPYLTRGAALRKGLQYANSENKPDFWGSYLIDDATSSD